MKEMGRTLLMALLILGLCRMAQSSDVGTTGGNILNMGIGARAMAMGEAYTAMSDDISSLYWNPAGLGLLNQSQASFMYNPSYTNLQYQNAAVAFSLENGGIGGSLSYQSFGSIQGYDINNNPTGNVNAHSGVGTVGAGWYGGPWAFGFNLKGVQATLADVSALGVAADFGGIYTYQKPVIADGTLRLAASLRNLGTGLKFIDERDSFPVEGRFGAALVQMMDRKLSYSLDFGKEQAAPWSVYTGAEYWLIPAIAVRAGYVNSGQEGIGIRAGIGLKIKDLSFDYAYSSYGDLGMSNLYELVYRFGPIRPTLTPEEREMLRRAKLAMAQQRFDEATMLFDSLITLEPHYKPFRRYIKTAMRGFEEQEHQVAEINKPYHMNLYGAPKETDPEMKELADMIDGQSGVKTAAVPAAAPATGAAAPAVAAQAGLPPQIDVNEPTGGEAQPEPKAAKPAIAAAPQEAKPNPEENTLAPYVPSVDPNDPLNVDVPGGKKP